MSPENHVEAYAKAFYEAAWERWLAILDGLANRLVQDPALLAQIEAGSDLAQRQRILDGYLPADVDPPVRNFLHMLLERGKLGSLGEIQQALREQLERGAHSPLDVEIVSAVALTDQECRTLRAKLEHQFGTGNLNLHHRVDPAILGGMIIRAGDKLIDGSLATRLAEMRQALGVAGKS